MIKSYSLCLLKVYKIYDDGIYDDRFYDGIYDDGILVPNLRTQLRSLAKVKTSYILFLFIH